MLFLHEFMNYDVKKLADFQISDVDVMKEKVINTIRKSTLIKK